MSDGHVTFTTEIPDVEWIDLDASEQSEITAEWDDFLNNGQFRLQKHDIEDEDDEPDWSDPDSEVTQAHNIDEHTFTGLLDGEKYVFRIRTETDYREGDWLETDTITKIVPATDAEVAVEGPTEAVISWTDNSDFRGSYQIWRARADWDYGDDPGRLIATVADDTETYTDDDPSPGREYEYTVRVRTQWVWADSDSATGETDGLGVPQRALPARGWHAEIAPESGRTHQLSLLEDNAQFRPTVNGLPRVDLPVPKNDKWQAPAFDDAPLSVWKDGRRLPIDVKDHARQRPDRTILEGHGGTELLTRVEEEVDVEEAHEFAEWLIEEYTGYIANVDDPEADIEEETSLQSASTESAFLSQLMEIPDDVPLDIDEDGPFLLDSLRWLEAQSGDGALFLEREDFSQGAGRRIGSAVHSFTVDFETDHRIPADDIEVEFRCQADDGDHPGFRILINDEEMASINEDAFTDSLSWRNLGGSISADLDPGEHEIEFDATGGDGQLDIDVVAVYDGRYEYGEFDDEVDEDNNLEGPATKPDLVRFETEPVTTPIAIRRVRAVANGTQGGGVAEIGIGIDGSDDYDIAEDTDEHELDYEELETTARLRFGLGRSDATRDTESPTTGFESHRMHSFELFADLDDTPLLTNRTFDARLIDVLRDIADYGNFVFEIQQDGDGTTVEWTQIGARTSDRAAALVDFELDRQTEDRVERAIIYGSSQRVVRESFEADVGEWVPLEHERLTKGRESVYDPETDETFEEGADYRVRALTGEIRVLDDGDMEDSKTYQIDYERKSYGEFTLPEAEQSDGEPRTVVETFPELTTDQACEQVALYLVQEASEAIWEGTATIPGDADVWSVIEAINPDELPTGGEYLQIREDDTTPGQQTFRLASRRSVGEIVADIQDRLRRTSERV